MRYILLITFIVVVFSLKGQTSHYKYSYSFTISGNNTPTDQKSNIDFLRNHFSSKKCTFNTSNSTYTLFLNHLIDTNALKNKLISKGIPVSNNIQLNNIAITDSQSQQNNN